MVNSKSLTPSKAYPAATITRLGLIQQAKSLGFTLAEIADVLYLWENAQLSSAAIQVRITDKVAAINEKIRLLDVMRAGLLRNLAAPQPCPCG